MLNNSTFYPTPPELIDRMIEKIRLDPSRVLEPSAGKGDIVEALIKEKWHPGKGMRGGYASSICHQSAVSAIEIDKDLRATLRGKGIKVIDTDFLTFAGPDKFDLIIANPPFDNGCLHLLKAIEIMYRGQIIFLLNASTIKNPCNQNRKLLVEKLKELDAEIEYIPNAFKDAERQTDVEVALVDIVIERQIEDDLFVGCEQAVEKEYKPPADKHELITGKRISDLVAEHDEIVRIATESILAYYRNYKKIGKYIGLNKEPSRYGGPDDLTAIVQGTLNITVEEIRTDFWRKTLSLPEVTRRLTADKQKEFEHAVELRCQMAFTENNIRQFVLNLIGGYEDSLRDSILKLFDKFTIKHCYNGGPMEKNIHYFNGWKTNNAFKVAKRIIVPFYGGYGSGPFRDWGSWRLDYNTARDLRDIDVVMNYFDGMEPGYLTVAQALEEAFSLNKNQTSSTYFSKIIAYKKGTLHLTFRDDDILRRFNIEACKGKQWLPEEYGRDPYHDADANHRAVIDSFEGEKSYVENYGRIGLNCPKFAAIEATGQREFAF